MRVIIIESGQLYEFPVTKDHTVLQLKEMLMKSIGLSVEDQILLYEGQRLGNNETLGKYSLPMSLGDVFLLDKTLLNDSKEFVEETLPIVETEAKPVSMMISSQDAHITGLFALKKIEHQFIDDFNSAQTLIEASKTYAKLAAQYTGDQERMLKGLGVAFVNLQDHFKQVQAAANDTLIPPHKANFLKHQKALESFDSIVQKIKATKIHPVLAQNFSQRTDTNTSDPTLKDFIPNFETAIFKLKSDCEASHVQLNKQVSTVPPALAAIKEEVDQQLQQKFDIDPIVFQPSVKKANEIASDVSLRLEIFQKNLDRIQEALSILRKTQVASSVEIWDDISGANTSQLALLTQPAAVVKNIASQILATKNKMRYFVISQLVNLYKIQSKITEVANTIVRCCDSLMRQQRALFQQLISIENLPRAYEAALGEVSRRRKFTKIFNSLITEANDSAVKMLIEEKAKRKEFIERYGAYLPRDLVPGLLEDVPQVQLLQTPAFDTNLPPIDLSDSYRLELSPSSSFSRFKEAPSERSINLEKENERLALELKTLKENLSNQNSSMLKSKESIIQPEIYFQLKQEYEKSKQQGMDYQKRIENLEGQLSTSYAHISHAETKASQYQEQLKKTEKKIEDVQTTEVMKAQKLLAEKDAEIERLKALQNEMTAKIEDQAAKIREQNDSLEDLEHKITIEEAKTSAAESKVEELEEMLSSTTKKLKILQTQVSDLTERTEELEVQLEAKSEEIDKAQQDLVYCKEINVTLENKLEEMTGASKAEISGLKNEIVSLKEQNEKLAQDLERETQERLNAEEFLSKSNLVSDSATKNLLDTKEQLSKTRTELKAVQETLNLTATQLEKSSQSEKNLEQLLETAKADYNSAKQKSENVQNQFLNYVKLMDQKSKEHTDLVSELRKENEKLIDSAKASHDGIVGVNAFVLEMEKTLKIPHMNAAPADALIIIKRKIQDQLESEKQLIERLQADIKSLQYIASLNPNPKTPTTKTSHVISLDNFKLGDRVLFLWDEAKQCYQAYQRNKPNSHVFLSTSVVEHLSETEKTNRSPIIGEIVLIEELKATNAYNPFSLVVNTMFSEVYVEKCKQFLI